MTTRRPLAVINGDLQEIPVGDSIAADLVPPVKLYVQDTAPSPTPTGTYVWVQTFANHDFTIWFEDGH